MAKCYACPRECGVDRDEKRGYCGAGNEILIAKTMVHRFEEPPISGTRGSGAIFFGGCNLGCVYCQNAEISVRAAGKPTTAAELEKIIFDLEEKGVHNIDLITAAHFVPSLAHVLEKIKPKLSIPIVYNSGGYEKRETLRLLDGLIDVYLPDYKYRSGELAKKFSFAPDYPEVAEAALDEMTRQQPEFVTDDSGIAKRGVIVRHLVLPAHRDDSIAVMKLLAGRFPTVKLSLMRQYTPEFNRSKYRELNRRVTSFEYKSVVDEAVRLGLDGFTQDASSATAAFTPDFSEN